ncbi:MAG: hypothetical protein IJP78_08090 [Clostridia bacterium]|nr:hypothetical protein [Clostridia bacterium]
MDAAHWIMVGLTAALLTALWLISVFYSPKIRGYRWGQRVFWTAAFLWISGSMGGIGLNGINLIAASALGLPGYAALWMIARL